MVEVTTATLKRYVLGAYGFVEMARAEMRRAMRSYSLPNDVIKVVKENAR